MSNNIVKLDIILPNPKENNGKKTKKHEV